MLSDAAQVPLEPAPVRTITRYDCLKRVVVYLGIALPLFSLMGIVSDYGKVVVWVGAWLAAWFLYFPVTAGCDWGTIRRTGKPITLTALQRERRTNAFWCWGVLVTTMYAVLQNIDNGFYFHRMFTSPDAPPGEGLCVLVVLAALLMASVWIPVFVMWNVAVKGKLSLSAAEREAAQPETDITAVPVASSTMPRHWWTDNGTRDEINEVKVGRSK